MSGKRKKQKKSNTSPPETGDFEVRDPVDPVESCVQELLHSMIKSFMDSVVTSIYKRAYWRRSQGCRRSIKS